MEVVIQKVLLFVILVLFGYLLKTMHFMKTEDTRFLSSLSVNILIPAMFFSGMNITYTRDRAHNVLLIMLVITLLELIHIVLSNILVHFFHEKPEQSAVSIVGMSFSNIGMIGAPFLKAMFGEEMMFYAIIANTIMSLYLYTYGIGIYEKVSGTKNLKSSFLNPANIAGILGLLVFFTGFHVPDLMMNSIDQIGVACMPISMIAIGATLAELPVKELIGGIRNFVVVIMKLLIFPIIDLGLLVFVLRFVPEWMTCILVLMAGVPSVASCGLLAEQFKCDSRKGCQIVFLTTICCVITIPCLVMILTLAGYTV